MDERTSLATSPAKPGALPEAAILGLFRRFALRYGSAWLAKWAGIPMDEVKAEWASELGRFEYAHIGEAVRLCGTFPPSLNEFVELCASARDLDRERRRMTQLTVVERVPDNIPPAAQATIDHLLGRRRKP